MWKWDQSAGELSRGGKLVSRGYSGNGRGKNNPTLDRDAGIGPIPGGRYRMVRIYDSQNVGPRAIELHAIDATPDDDRQDATGRSAFRIHGDSVKSPGTASHGCIILPRSVREAMWASGDRELEVVA